MSHDQRRFVTARTVRDPKGKPISITGHLIGSGPRSVVSMQRKLVMEMFSQFNRQAKGRFAWALNRTTDTTSLPDPLTRQVKRRQERDACKRYASKNGGNWRLWLLYPELVQANH